jgi:hypothetical protein
MGGGFPHKDTSPDRRSIHKILSPLDPERREIVMCRAVILAGGFSTHARPCTRERERERERERVQAIRVHQDGPELDALPAMETESLTHALALAHSCISETRVRGEGERDNITGHAFVEEETEGGQPGDYGVCVRDCVCERNGLRVCDRKKR